jgi:O-antigen/teichoic acid export membrane protein
MIFFFLLALLYFLKIISFINAISYYTLSVVLAGCAIIYYTFRKIPSGKKALPASITKSGIYYFGMAISIGLILQTSYLFIGKMLSLKDLAVYAVIASIMRLFEFTQDSTYYVLAPHLNTRSNIPIKKIILALLLLSCGITLIYIFFAKIAVHILFKGLYDEGVYLLPFFIGIGIVKTLYIFPASIIGGRTSESTLRNQFYITGLAALLNICLTYVFISKWKLTGAASASLLTWILLFVVALYGTKKHIIYNESDYGSSM